MTTATRTQADQGTTTRGADEAMREDVVRVLSADGELVSDAPELDDALVVDLYRAMARARACDLRAAALRDEGRIGAYDGSAGEEATTIGSTLALRDDDWIFPTHREPTVALARGGSVEAFFHHLFGNALDGVKGRQMPGGFAARSLRIASASAPVGTQLTHAVGLAWAARIRKDDVVALAHFGERATSSGPFHNAMNFAGVFKTPAVMLCRNSSWPQVSETETITDTFAEKGIAYGVPGVRCDGNDPLAVLRVVRHAVARATRGEGTTLVEALAHPLDGPEGARLDPLVRLRNYLGLRGHWSDAAQAELDESLQQEIDQAVAAASAAPTPPRTTMFDDVFATLPGHLRDQRDA